MWSTFLRYAASGVTDCHPSSTMTNRAGVPPAARLATPASTPAGVTLW